MRNALKGFVLLAVAAVLLSVPAQAQVKLEFSLFGGYGFNLGFAPDVAVDTAFHNGTSVWYNAWQPFFNDPVLELKAGPSFGARATLWFTPMIGFEGSFEYALAKPRFNEVAVADLEDQMDSINYMQYFNMVPEGGHLIRFNGNIIFNLMPGGIVTPYLTAGIGMTSYSIEPNISVERSGYNESMSMTYSSPSALTFNGGGGLTYWVSPMIGLRFDARIFYSSPAFDQTFSYKVFGTWQWPEDIYITQSGGHIDAVITAGVTIRVI